MEYFVYLCIKTIRLMLNIEDIYERLDRNKEPKEIEEIRQHILSAFKDLEFIEEGHKYYLNKEDGSKIEMNSVSSVCHRFEPYVDWDGIRARKAEKLGITDSELKRKWRENNLQSTSNGTLTHLFAEAYMYFFMGQVDKMPSVIREMQYEDGFLIPYGEKQKAVAKYYEDLHKVNGLWAVMPETKIYIDSTDNPFGIHVNVSGTFDALFAYQDKNGKWKLSVRDWKTNTSLTNSFNISNHNTLLYPFDGGEFINQPKSIYTIQLSLYQLGLQQLGYEISDRKLLWLTDDAEYHKIDVPDVSKTLIDYLSSDDVKE